MNETLNKDWTRDDYIDFVYGLSCTIFGVIIGLVIAYFSLEII